MRAQVTVVHPSRDAAPKTVEPSARPRKKKDQIVDEPVDAAITTLEE